MWRYGDLNYKGPRRLEYLDTWSPVNELGGDLGGAGYLKVVCYRRQMLVFTASPHLPWSLCFMAMWEVVFRHPLAPTAMPATCCWASPCYDRLVSLWTSKQKVNSSFPKLLLVVVFYRNDRTVTKLERKLFLANNKINFASDEESSLTPRYAARSWCHTLVICFYCTFKGCFRGWRAYRRNQAHEDGPRTAV